MDRLVEIPLSQLIILCDMYEKGWPKNEIGLYVLKNYVSWLTRNPEIPGFRAYCLNGDCSDGTFVIIHLSLICGYTLSEDTTRLKTALDLLELDPKSHYRYFYEPSMRSMVWQFLKEKRLRTGKETNFLCYHLTPEVGSKLIVPILPKGFVAANIPMELVLNVNDNWPYHYPKSEERLELLLKYNPNLAVYTGSGELAGWALRYEYGAVAMLHVNEPFRKLGLGRYIATALSKMIADSGEHTCATMTQQNEVSARLFESLGYKQNGHKYYLEILPSETL